MNVDINKYHLNHYSEEIHTLEGCIENRRKILLDFIEKNKLNNSQGLDKITEEFSEKPELNSSEIFNFPDTSYYG